MSPTSLSKKVKFQKYPCFDRNGAILGENGREDAYGAISRSKEIKKRGKKSIEKIKTVKFKITFTLHMETLIYILA